MNCGVVYVAYGEKYVAEASVSARSVKRTNPSLKTFLLTGETASPEGIDEVIHRDLSRTYIDKSLVWEVPCEKILFLDSDTRVIGNIGEIFTLLDRFDFAAHQASAGYQIDDPDVPHSFPVFNAGVLAFRKTPATRAMLDRWIELFPGGPLDHAGAISDQPALRKAVYETDLRFAVLASEYNIMPMAPMGLGRDARILHGRPSSTLDFMEKHINSVGGRRAWIPHVGCIGRPVNQSFREAFPVFLRGAKRFFLISRRLRRMAK